ncbi:MAG: UDP-N-acetylmuramoyl-L-alanyl-D-glutamate--2,6-diaminopimelate ligase [Syntrophobacter sp.]
MKTLGELIDGLTVVETRGDMGATISSVCCDSRKAVAGSLFVCLPGSRVDGHSFIRDALSNGAVAVVCESEAGKDIPAAVVRVRDSRGALAAISASFYDHPASKLKLVGITGTNGKTTTSLLLESILRHAGFEPGVLGTLSYRWAGKEIPASMTTPESLDLQRILHEMLGDGVTHVVMEVSSHSLVLGRVAGLAFRAGVFTNLSQDHLDFHKTMEDYFLAKKLLFSNYLDPQASAAVINADDPYGMKLLENGTRAARAVGYSAKIYPGLPGTNGTHAPGKASDPPGRGSEQANGAASTVQGRDSVCTEAVDFGPDGICARVMTPRGAIEIRSALVGRLNLYNILAAVSAGSCLDVPLNAIAAGIEAVSEVDGRLQRVQVPAWFGCGVIVDYAHTPDAMEKALGCLREMTSGRLIAVFGCGGDRDNGKRPLMGGIAARCADVVVLTSDNPRTEDPEKILDQIEAGLSGLDIRRAEPNSSLPAGKWYVRISDRRKAIEFGLSAARPGDLLFIGGKGHETYQIIGYTKHSFDDRIVVRDYFQKTQVFGESAKDVVDTGNSY